MTDTLFMAILALDSYTPRTKDAVVGDATVLAASSTAANSPEVAAGFYAGAYQLPDGSIVISYRGTVINPLSTFWDDIWNGWGVATGWRRS